MGLIDFRCRPPIPEYLAYFEVPRMERINARTGGAGVPQSFVDRSVERFMEELDANDVELAVALGRIAPEAVMGEPHPAASIDADVLSRLKSEWPGRFVSFVAADMRKGSDERREELAAVFHESVADGLFVEPGRTGDLAMGDRSVVELVEVCAWYEKPVLLMSGPYAGPTLASTDVVQFERLISAFPAVDFVIGHGLWPNAAAAVALIFKYDNAFLCPDFYTFMPGGEPYLAAMKSNELRNQMIFGSGYPVWDVGDMLARHREVLSKEELLTIAATVPNRVLGRLQ